MPEPKNKTIGMIAIIPPSPKITNWDSMHQAVMVSAVVTIMNIWVDVHGEESGTAVIGRESSGSCSPVEVKEGL